MENIRKIKEQKVYFVETDTYVYTRYSSNIWGYILKEKEYEITDCTELENAFQEFMQKEEQKPFQWLRNKLGIVKGSSYHEPKITLTQCASWINEYVNTFYK